MRFHGLLIARDEGDIIAQTLTHLLTWCDCLHTDRIMHNFTRREK